MQMASLRPTPIALVALLWGGSFASAQLWEIGARTGVNHGALSGGQEFAWRAAGPSSAVFLRRSLSPILAVQPEISVLRWLGVSNQPASTLTLTADYIVLPLMLQLHPPGDASLQPYLSAGPSLAVRLRCTLLFEGGGLVSSNDCDASQGAKSNRLDVGIGTGGGVNVRVGSATITVDARFTSGLRTNVLPVDVQARTYGWAVSAGVSTALGRRSRPLPRALPRATPSYRSMSDENIAAMLLAFANTDISYSRLVPRRSLRADIRSYAEQMLAEHLRVNRSIHALLRQLDMGAEDSPPSLQLRDESSQQRDPLYSIGGTAFDTAYVNGEVRLHREFLAAIDDVLLMRAHRPEIRALLESLRPEVAAQLVEAERLRARVIPADRARPGPVP